MQAVAQKLLPQKCKPGSVAYCPTMDLVALVMENDDLYVFRLNGQKVFGASYEDSAFKVSTIRWKPNGQLLAVACTDRTIRLLSASSGKTVHHLPALTSSSEARISCLGWGFNFTNSSLTQRQLANAKNGVNLDDLLSFNAQVSTLLKSKADLPRELALVDVETSLPKLSTLPSTGGDEDVFSTRASIDAIFHTRNRGSHSDFVDVLVTGFDDGSFHLRIFDSFEIGSISLISSLPPKSPSCKLLQHTCSPLSSTHALLVRTEPVSTKAKPSLHVLAVDLRFIAQTAPYYLSTLASKITQLQNLLRYLLQIQSQLAFEVKSAFELPSKYLRNINETLAETTPHAAGADFVAAAYHLLATGECGPQLREWLADEVGERGLKRWEKSVHGGLETVRRLIHECLLPALERCAVLLSRLDGLSKFQRASRVLGLDSQPIHLVKDTLDCLNLLATELLKVLGNEIKKFVAFCKWMKLEVEVQSTEHGSERAEELREGAEGLDYRVVLDYLSGAMNRSRTLDYLRPAKSNKEEGSKHGAEHDIDQSSYYSTYKKLLKGPRNLDRLPKLDDFLLKLKCRCEKMFEQIAETLRKSILHSHVLQMKEAADPDVVDMRLVADQDENGVMSIRVVARHTTTEEAIIYNCLQGKESGGSITNIRSQYAKEFHVPGKARVCDVRFVDDGALMVLALASKQAYIYNLPVTGDMRSAEWELRHTFRLEGAGSFTPSRVEINGRKGRRAVCVLDDSALRYMIFDLDSTLSSSPEDEDGNGEDDEAMIE